MGELEEEVNMVSIDPEERMEELEEEVNMVSIDPETKKDRQITVPRRFQHFYYF